MPLSEFIFQRTQCWNGIRDALGRRLIGTEGSRGKPIGVNLRIPEIILAAKRRKIDAMRPFAIMLRTKFSGVALTSSKRDYLFNYFVGSEDNYLPPKL